jgi:predicted methyltransferase
MLRLASACAVAVALVISAPVQAADAKLAAAVSGAQRAADHTARDGARHPVVTLTFWGV